MVGDRLWLVEQRCHDVTYTWPLWRGKFIILHDTFTRNKFESGGPLRWLKMGTLFNFQLSHRCANTEASVFSDVGQGRSARFIDVSRTITKGLKWNRKEERIDLKGSVSLRAKNIPTASDSNRQSVLFRAVSQEPTDLGRHFLSISSFPGSVRSFKVHCNSSRRSTSR